MAMKIILLIFGLIGTVISGHPGIGAEDLADVLQDGLDGGYGHPQGGYDHLNNGFGGYGHGIKEPLLGPGAYIGHHAPVAGHYGGGYYGQYPLPLGPLFRGHGQRYHKLPLIHYGNVGDWKPILKKPVVGPAPVVKKVEAKELAHKVAAQKEAAHRLAAYAQNAKAVKGLSHGGHKALIPAVSVYKEAAYGLPAYGESVGVVKCSGHGGHKKPLPVISAQKQAAYGVPAYRQPFGALNGYGGVGGLKQHLPVHPLYNAAVHGLPAYGKLGGAEEGIGLGEHKKRLPLLPAYKEAGYGLSAHGSLGAAVKGIGGHKDLPLSPAYKEAALGYGPLSSKEGLLQLAELKEEKHYHDKDIAYGAALKGLGVRGPYAHYRPDLPLYKSKYFGVQPSLSYGYSYKLIPTSAYAPVFGYEKEQELLRLQGGPGYAHGPELAYGPDYAH